MAPSILYTSSVLGAIALYLLLRPGPRPLKALGVLLGLGALGWLTKESVAALGAPDERAPAPFLVIFSLIAVSAAVRMITHHRPVYSALYFVMVIMSSAGLFLLLEAEFMAFALIIVYAGAILITYLFVLMLAQQAPQAGEQEYQPDYDRVPREPAAAVTVGFILLALLADTIFNQAEGLPPAPTATEVRAVAWRDLESMPGRLESVVRGEIGDFASFVDDAGDRVRVDGEGAAVAILDETQSTQVVTLPDEALPENIQRVGLGLVRDFPVSLELAGVILLLAMYGAVVLARRQIELAEHEKRQAGGAGT